MKFPITFLLLFLHLALFSQERLSDFESKVDVSNYNLVEYKGTNYAIIVGENGGVVSNRIKNGTVFHMHSRSFDLAYEETMILGHHLLMRTDEQIIVYDFIADKMVFIDFDKCFNIFYFNTRKVINSESVLLTYRDECNSLKTSHVILNVNGNLDYIDARGYTTGWNSDFLTFREEDTTSIWSISEEKVIRTFVQENEKELLIDDKFYYSVNEIYMKVLELNDPLLQEKWIGDLPLTNKGKIVAIDQSLVHLEVDGFELLVYIWDAVNFEKKTQTFRLKEEDVKINSINIVEDFIIVEGDSLNYFLHRSGDSARDFETPKLTDSNFKNQFKNNSFLSFTNSGCKFIDLDQKQIIHLDNKKYNNISPVEFTTERTGFFIKRKREDLYYLELSTKELSQLSPDERLSDGLIRPELFQCDDKVLVYQDSSIYLYFEEEFQKISTGDVTITPLIVEEPNATFALFFEEADIGINVKKLEGNKVITIATIPSVLKPINRKYIYKDGYLGFSDGESYFSLNTLTNDIIALEIDLSASIAIVFHQGYIFQTTNKGIFRYNYDGSETSFPINLSHLYIIGNDLFSYRNYAGLEIYNELEEKFDPLSFSNLQGGSFGSYSTLINSTTLYFKYRIGDEETFCLFNNNKVETIGTFKEEDRWSFNRVTDQYAVLRRISNIENIEVLVIDRETKEQKRFSYPKFTLNNIRETESKLHLYCSEFAKFSSLIKEIDFNAGTSKDVFNKTFDYGFNKTPAFHTINNKDYVATAKSLLSFKDGEYIDVDRVNMYLYSRKTIRNGSYIYYLGDDPFKGTQLYRYNPESPNETKDNTLNSLVKIYPNPTQNQLTIEAPNPMKSIRIYDNQGRAIEQHTFSQKRITLSTTNWSNGIYYINIIGSSGTSTSYPILKFE